MGEHQSLKLAHLPISWGGPVVLYVLVVLYVPLLLEVLYFTSLRFYKRTLLQVYAFRLRYLNYLVVDIVLIDGMM